MSGMRGDLVNIGAPQLVQNQRYTTSPVGVSRSSYRLSRSTPDVHSNCWKYISGVSSSLYESRVYRTRKPCIRSVSSSAISAAIFTVADGKVDLIAYDSKCHLLAQAGASSRLACLSCHAASKLEMRKGDEWWGQRLGRGASGLNVSLPTTALSICSNLSQVP